MSPLRPGSVAPARLAGLDASAKRLGEGRGTKDKITVFMKFEKRKGSAILRLFFLLSTKRVDLHM